MTVLVQTRGRVRIVSINRPEVRNAVDPKTAGVLFEAFRAFELDTTVDVAILTGGQTAFCAGFDLKAASAGLGGSGKTPWRSRTSGKTLSHSRSQDRWAPLV